MLEFLVEIASKIFTYILAFFWRQLHYVLFYKNNLNKLKEQVEDLEGQRERIQLWLDAERRNGKTVSPAVSKWLEEVEKITKEAEQLQDNADHASVGCCCPNLKLRHQLGENAKTKAKNVGDLKLKGEFTSVAYDPPSETDFTAYIRGIEIFESRMSIMNEIVQAVTAPNVSTVGVYGLGGVGKTTLMYQVAAKAKLEKLFDAVVMASVTRTPNLISVQGEIADQLDLKLKKETFFGRASCLRERIKQEKSILVILDDIWEIFDVNEVGIPLSDLKGCKVLMTSRTHEVLNEMGSQKECRLEPLDESETWSLFQVMAGDVVTDHQDIATQVASKCAGLPVLIVTVSRALKGKGIRAWKDASKRLTTVNNKNLQEIYHSALELSYNGLEGNDVKELFLLCGVLGTSTSINDLLKYGMGLGIFKDVNTVEDARNRLYSMIDKLKASCLLLEDDKFTGFVEMHDNVREVAVSIAFRDEHVSTFQRSAELKEWPTERCAQIILNRCRIHQLPKKLYNPELKLLSWDSATIHSLEIPDFFFEGVTNLKVLDLTCMSISSIPTSLSCLTKLKTLCLDRCALGGMTALGALKNIEILSLYKSSITKLPVEIGSLICLRMLDLSCSGIELIPPNIISSLINLEEFYAGDTSIKWEAENAITQNKNAGIAELCKLPRLTALDVQIQDALVLPRDNSFFGQLQRYKIFIGEGWTWDCMYEDSNILKIKLSNSTHLGQGLRKLLEGVEDLHLDEFKGISNVLYQLNSEGFLQMRSLCIQNNNEIQHIVNSTEYIQHQDAFPKLEVLHLYKLNKLEKICHGPLTNISFQKLKVIKVKSCDRLKSLISSSMVKGLSQLLQVEVSECNFMEEIVAAENSVSGDIEITMIEFHQLRFLTLQCLSALTEFYSDKLNTSQSKPLFSSKVAFYNLETLKLSSINMKIIWDESQFLTTCYLQNLTSLIVEGCGNIKYLFLPSMVGSFSKLKLLEISDCHAMEEIVALEEGRNNGGNLAKVQFPKLEKMIINDMKNLKTIWHQQFESLRTMEVKNCEKLVRIFPSHMQTKFSSLETLTIIGCSSLEEIFELNANENDEKDIEVNTQLRNLTLHEMPNLKQIWSGEPKGILRFHNLEAVSVEDCPKLEYLFPLSMAMDLPQLEEILIKQAPSMKEFVVKIEGYKQETVKFELNRLTKLVLFNLHEADRFYDGNFTLDCPSLKILNVFHCPKLELFKTKSMSYPERDHDGNLNVSTPQPFFIAEEVIPKLEELNLTAKDVLKIQQVQFPVDFHSKLAVLRLQFFNNEDATFLYRILQKLPNLKSLWIQYCSFKKILHKGEKEQIEITTRLKSLHLGEVHKIQHLCEEGSRLDPVLEVVERIELCQCSGLIYLVPSYVTFSHLTYLIVWQCNRLLYIISSSTARSLVNLIRLDVLECESVEEIVKEKGDEMEQNIAFNKLRILELKCLPSLSWFSSSKCLLWFPELEEVLVEQCPKIKTFSNGDTVTPDLRNVQVVEGCFWEGNLNATIKKISTHDAHKEG